MRTLMLGSLTKEMKVTQRLTPSTLFSAIDPVSSHVSTTAAPAPPYSSWLTCKPGVQIHVFSVP